MPVRQADFIGHTWLGQQHRLLGQHIVGRYTECCPSSAMVHTTVLSFMKSHQILSAGLTCLSGIQPLNFAASGTSLKVFLMPAVRAHL